MTDGDDAWCKDCLKINFEQLFRPTSRSRTRKFVLPAHKDARLGHPVCPMCHFIRETRRLYDTAYLMSYGHRPEPSVSTGKIQSVLLAGSKHSPWPTILAAEADHLDMLPETVHAWFKADSSSHQESSDPAVLITFEDPGGSTHPLPRQRSKHELEDSTIDTAMLRAWMRSTDRDTADSLSHPLSPSQPCQAQSLKLIDVKRRHVVPADTSFRYLALSYVWGTELPQQDWLTSLSGTKSARLRGMLPTHLPDTFEDALKLTQDLGERYLWIDLFCIKQDDPRHVQEQIEQMHHIYASATCTIVAYDSEDAFSGLAGVSRPLKLRSQPMVHTPSGGRMTATWLPSTDVRRGATFSWNSRAWCFQEKFFSTRVLFLQEYETMMVTEQAVQHDIFRPGTALRLDEWSFSPSIVNLGSQGFLRAYSDLLHDYTGRFLTHPADAINAFGGILSALRHETHQEFRYGISLSDPHRGLLWSAADEHILSPRGGFPTWSWCGWLGPVRYRDYLCAAQAPRASPPSTEPPDLNNGPEHHDSTPERAHLTLPPTETWSQSLNHPDHILHVRSSVITCTIRKLAQSREPSALTYVDATHGMARKQDLGYHWTLLSPHQHGTDDLPDPANNPCWPDLFDASPHWFRFSAAEEAILEEVAAITGNQKRSARSSSTTRSRTKAALQVDVEIVLIQRWHMVRDASGKVIRDAVGGLVVVPVVPREINSVGRRTRNLRRRVAAVLMEGRTFDAFDRVQRELELV